MVFGQKTLPVIYKDIEGLINLLVCLITVKHLPCKIFLDHVMSFPLIVLIVLDISKYEYEALLFTWLKCYVKLVYSNR